MENLTYITGKEHVNEKENAVKDTFHVEENGSEVGIRAGK